MGALGLAGLIIVIALVFRRYRKDRVPIWLIAGMAFAPAAVIGLGLALSFYQLRQLRSALNEGRFAVVEGFVTGFQPGDGHRPETFEVAGHQYKYSSSTRSVAFNQDAAVGGPIRDSLRVRITDIGGQIARLEIAH